jgi:hypothetical protein
MKMLDADIEGNVALLGLDADNSSRPLARLRKRLERATNVRSEDHEPSRTSSTALLRGKKGGGKALLEQDEESTERAPVEDDNDGDEDPNSKARRTNKPVYEPGPEYDDDLPYGGLVYLARRKKPDGWICIGVQVS